MRRSSGTRALGIAGALAILLTACSTTGAPTGGGAATATGPTATDAGKTFVFASTQFSWLIMDEAQTVKNSRSDVHKAVKTVRADRTIALSGTPIENDLGELWSLFQLVRPGLLGDEAWFREHFRIPIENRGDTERLATLRDWVAPHLLRRTKSEVAKT